MDSRLLDELLPPSLPNSVVIGASSPCVRHAVEIIATEFHLQLTATVVASRVRCSRAYLSTIFRMQLGMTVHDCLTEVRVMHANRLIKSGMKVEAVAIAIGCRSKTSLYRQLRGHASLEI